MIKAELKNRVSTGSNRGKQTDIKQPVKITATVKREESKDAVHRSR